MRIEPYGDIECCGECKFYAELCKNFKQGVGYEYSHCCVALKDYIVECNYGDMCEMFSPKEA